MNTVVENEDEDFDVDRKVKDPWWLEITDQIVLSIRGWLCDSSRSARYAAVMCLNAAFKVHII